LNPARTASPTAPLTPTSAARWPELDGIRCLAVFGVLAVHFAPSSLPGPWGAWGVQCFFVLSGFLITHGLLSARARIDARQTTVRAETRAFFLRRVVRLWPLYFATVAVIAALNVETSRSLLPWNLTFTTNYFIATTGHWAGLHSHFWTLAVEQQFYLFWPFLFLLAPARATLISVGLLIVTSPLLRAWELAGLAAAGASFEAPAGVLLPMCADSLAWGALLALLVSSRSAVVGRLARWGGLFAIPLFGILYLYFRFGPDRFASPYACAFSGTVLAIASALLVAHCIGVPDSIVRRILRFAPFVYLGGISYGIYVIHNFNHWIGPSILLRLTGKPYFDSELAHVAFLVLLSVLFAALSWHFFERPVLRLGRRKIQKARA